MIHQFLENYVTASYDTAFKNPSVLLTYNYFPNTVSKNM
jgi:hypothetical protein